MARGGAEQVVAGAPYANGLPAAVRSGIGAGKKSEKAGKRSERRRQGLQGPRGLPGWKYDWKGLKRSMKRRATTERNMERGAVFTIKFLLYCSTVLNPASGA